MVSINKKNYKPPLKDVKERYYEKFRKSTKDNTSGAGPPAAPAPAVTLRRSMCSTDTGWADAVLALCCTDMGCGQLVGVPTHDFMSYLESPPPPIDS